MIHIDTPLPPRSAYREARSPLSPLNLSPYAPGWPRFPSSIDSLETPPSARIKNVTIRTDDLPTFPKEFSFDTFQSIRSSRRQLLGADQGTLGPLPIPVSLRVDPVEPAAVSTPSDDPNPLATFVAKHIHSALCSQPEDPLSVSSYVLTTQSYKLLHLMRLERGHGQTYALPPFRFFCQ